MHGTLVIVVSLLLAFALRRFIEYKKALRSVNNHPGYRLLLNTLGPAENFFPRIPGVTAGNFHMWARKHKDFELYGCDIITYASICFLWQQNKFLCGGRGRFEGLTYIAIRATLCPKHSHVAQEITTHRARFPKPIWQYKLLTVYGDNILTTEGDEWKRFRRITAPAFSERNNKLVWDETVRIVRDLFAQWGSLKEVSYEHAVDLTLPTALFVIGVAGFGRRMSWDEDDVVPPGHKMTFKASGVFTRLAWPLWILRLGLTEHHRTVITAFDELEAYMHEMIRERRSSEKKEERYDLFSSLLDANEVEEEGQVKMVDTELIGNTFIFLLAGHETTAHTLCYALALLALHPDEQETLYQESKRLVPGDQLPEYENINAFSYCLAILNETLRMFPPVHSIPKSVAEDTSITVINVAGDKVTIPMPSGSNISMHMPGLHYNPRYWPDPYRFNPKRFLGDWPKDAFLPFSAGPRACLGRRFTETESIAVLTMIVLNYKICILEEPQFAEESPEERRERVLRSRSGVSMTPVRVPLLFKKRV
ncbi:hypothetical protein NM688_g9161 [Phlebia brevispora]|uniref:Uncharacterized protein n=1 Tax=Phlebia brevispora TaxID=194682 RepID=A0ACC1RLD9_9APHY|nr:hypothetical protein NM688_g9161 [Phlebia brevispora]